MKHKTLRTLLCVILTVCFCLSAIVPASAAGLFGGNTGDASLWDQWIRSLKDRFTETQPGTGDTPVEQAANDDFYRIVHLDCGRKYFSVENIEKLIDTMAKYGYNQLQLAFGNGGCRFLLDDMSLYDDNDYILSSADVKKNITNGNKAFNGDDRYLTQDNMDAIIAYAGTKGIEIVPMLNMPGHASAIVYGTDYSDNGNLNVNDETSRIYGYTLLEKYVKYFKDKGCKFFHFGADESGYSGTGMNTFISECAGRIVSAGMTPRAFNDATNATGVTFPKTVQITYWHQENNSKSAAALGGDNVAAANKYELINTHGRWYYVIKTAQNSDIGTKYWQGTVNTSAVSVELPVLKATKMDSGKWVGINEFFDGNPGYGSTITDNKGVMFCIWCDTSQDAYLTDSDVISENENYGALYQLEKLAEHYWAEDINTDPDTSADNKTVNIKVGESVSFDVTDSTVDAGEKISGNEAYIANAVVAKTEAVAETTVSTTKATTVEDGASYILRVYDTNYALTTNTGKTAWGTETLAFETFTEAEDDNVWTLEASDEGYKLNSKAGYLNLGTGTNTGKVDTTGEDFVFTDTSTGWTIKNSSGIYINALGGIESLTAGGWTGDGTRFDLYKVTQATDANTTLTITGTGEGTTKVTVGGVEYTINVTAPDVTETKRLAYGGSFALPTGAVVTDAPTIGVTVADGKVTAGNVDAEAIVKAETKNAGGYVTKRYIYNVTVSDVDLSGVTPLSVELWVTNRYAGGTHNGVTYPATAGGHFVTISAESAYGADGILLEDFVPIRGTDEGNLPLLFWKGTRLAYANRQVYTGTDRTGSGNDFLKIRYYEDSWQYYSNDTWNTVLTTDQIIAYYMQVYNTSPEIVTAFRDYGGIAGEGGGEYDDSWFAGYRGVATAVVYSDKSMSPDGDDGIWNNTLLCYYEGASGGGTPGLIKVFDTDEFKITKITITKGVHKDSTGATGADATKTWNRTTSSVAWDKTVNDAGDEWYDETLIWDREKDYTGGTIQLDDSVWGDIWKTSGIGEAFLLLFYVEPVQKNDDLKVVYWDDNVNTQINPTDITVGVKSGVTFLDIQQTSEVKVGTFTLDDDATIENSVGVKQKFNKNITILEGVAAGYKSGLYEYVSADISQDEKTLTLHYNIRKVPNALNYVVDFGLPIQIDGILSWLELDGDQVSLSVTRGQCVKSRHGTYGTATISNDQDSITYVLDETLDATAAIPVYIFNKEGTALSTEEPAVINIIPATNVYYEESFITNPENSGWTNTSTADSVEQTLEEAGKKQNVYGFDSKVENYYLGDPDDENSEGKGITYSMGNALTTTLSIPAGAKETMTKEPLTFSFKGTGFDLISECSDKTGILLVYIKGTKLNNDGKPYQGVFLVDTYFAGDNAPEGSTAIMAKGTTVYQVPVVREFGAFNEYYSNALTENAGLPYDTYQVSVYAYLNNNAGVFDNNAAAVASYNAAPVSDNSIIADALAACNITGIDADQVKLVYMDENSILNGGTGAAAEQNTVSMASLYAATVDSAEVYVDAFRVYNPLGDTTVQISNEKFDPAEKNEVQTYKDDNESGVKYMSLYDFVVGNLGSYGNEEDGTSSSVYVEYDGNKPANEQIVGKEYKVHGPENEIYLAKGCGIAFHINQYSDGQTIQISAKAVKAVDGENPTLNGGDVTATEMYYDLDKINSAIQGTGTGRDIVIFNGGDGVLAISGLKCSTAISISADSSATQAAIQTIRYAMSAKEVSYAPATFEITAPETARRNRSIGIGVMATAADVDSMKIQVTCDGVVVSEETILYPYNVKAVEQGKATNYYYSKSYRFSKAGTYVLTATASDGNGNSYSIEKTVVVK